MPQLRIIIDTALNTGEAEYQNLGDVAMLQVAINRLMKLWPSAVIEVLTESPNNLAKYCPGAKPLSRVGRNYWVDGNFLFFGRINKYLSQRLKFWLDKIKNALEHRCPALLRFFVYIRLKLRDGDNIFEDLMAFLKSLEAADLLIICGAGGFADSTRQWNMTTLGTLEVAIRRKIPVAMFGQAMGPLSDSEVLVRCNNILPAVSLITLRGGRGGHNMLESIGVPASKVLTTGDEAIELVYEARSNQLGKNLGINLRVAQYANIDKDIINLIKPILQDFARQHNIRIIPLPIAVHPWASDHQTIQQLLTGFDDRSDGGLSLDTPIKIIQQAGYCRIVVTGAYHAAVFALSQGIPVVCLTKSPYYTAKFLGLEDQFGLGCEIVSLDESNAKEKLKIAMEKAWQSAEIVRLPLQEAALSQIELSKSAYERVRDLVNSRMAIIN